MFSIESHFDALVTLVSAIIGAMIALIVTFYTHQLHQKAEKRRMASAFAGEIMAILEIARIRRMKEVLQSGVKLYQEGKHWTAWNWPISDDYFRVYRQNVDKIGLFKAPIPADIACFYTLCFAVVESLTTMGKTWDFRNGEFMIKALSQELEIVGRIEKLGEEISKKLHAV